MDTAAKVLTVLLIIYALLGIGRLFVVTHRAPTPAPPVEIETSPHP